MWTSFFPKLASVGFVILALLLRIAFIEPRPLSLPPPLKAGTRCCRGSLSGSRPRSAVWCPPTRGRWSGSAAPRTGSSRCGGEGRRWPTWPPWARRGSARRSTRSRAPRSSSGSVSESSDLLGSDRPPFLSPFVCLRLIQHINEVRQSGSGCCGAPCCPSWSLSRHVPELSSTIFVFYIQDMTIEAGLWFKSALNSIIFFKLLKTRRYQVSSVLTLTVY